MSSHILTPYRYILTSYSKNNNNDLRKFPLNSSKINSHVRNDEMANIRWNLNENHNRYDKFLDPECLVIICAPVFSEGIFLFFFTMFRAGRQRGLLESQGREATSSMFTALLRFANHLHADCSERRFSVQNAKKAFRAFRGGR